jgi:DNA-binding CsgD family transcriptional regulator
MGYGARERPKGVSENTAVNHCRNLYGKFGVHSRAELIESLNARL